MYEYWKERILDHSSIIRSIAENEHILCCIDNVATILVQMYKNGGKLLICGNGGSAADAQHIAAELVSRFFMERRALDAEALSVNTSSISAIGNDYSYDYVFARQVEAKGQKGDVLLGISTSGNSKNVIEAMRKAKDSGLITVGLTGNDKESLIYEASDYCIGVPSDITPRIQEAHILIGHMLCEFIESELFGGNEIC